MADNANLSLRQLGTPDLNHQPLCITFSTLENNATFELKSVLIHLLPSFHGLAGEDPHKHLMEFHVVCTSMKPHGVTEEQIQLRAFPFSLKNAAKDCLYYLPPGSITTWTEMKIIFLEKYFPASRAANIRKENYGIKQYTGESLHEYWERFKKLCARCWKDHPNLRYGNPSMNQPAPQEMRGSIQHLNTQVGQLATTVNSGRELKVHEKVMKEPVHNEDVKESKVEENELNHKDTPRDFRKDENIKELYETFHRCEINISLLDAIKQRKTPEKCKDSGMFSITCKIGDVQLNTTMLDLGASINVMSYSFYASLKLRPLNETTTVIQMADRSTINPRGVIEYVLVQVGNFVFHADFYVLDMKNNDLKSPILLGRLFLKTSKSVIDANNGTLTMEFDGEIVKFNIFDNLNFLSCESAVNNLDINDYLSQEHKKVVNECKLKEVVARPVKISFSDLQAPEAEEPRISRNSKTRPKLTVKNRVPPPPQSEFQYDSSVIPLGMEEDDTANT
ncbi:uncharacterized protein [Henckelia pumila]|uniref:uncharacterized protein n=1 Tax=Henckelia pumila TaxID=405737 RepID=UPI003C6E8C2D